MNQGPPSLAVLASAGRPLPTRISNSYNMSAVIVVDINPVHEIGSGPDRHRRANSVASPMPCWMPYTHSDSSNCGLVTGRPATPSRLRVLQEAAQVQPLNCCHHQPHRMVRPYVRRRNEQPALVSLWLLGADSTAHGLMIDRDQPKLRVGLFRDCS